MRGNRSIMEARMNGYHPEDIWLVLLDAKPIYTVANDPENGLQNGFKPEVHLYPSDNVKTADMRFIFGLNVHIIGDGDRVYQLANAIKRFKPKTVYTPDGVNHA